MKCHPLRFPAKRRTAMEKQKHMNLEIRTIIKEELDKGSSFALIGTITGKDPTTISKEVRSHAVTEQSGAFGRGFNDCSFNFISGCDLRHVCTNCTHKSRPCWSCGECRENCSRYEKYPCPKLEKPPYVCNACKSRNKCTLEKKYYRALSAQTEYENTRTESRSGFAVSEAELKHLDSLISPLLRQGQSLHHISVNHSDELMVSERTLYTYVNNGLFSSRNIDMPRTVRMRPRKKKSSGFKVDKKCRIGRTYNDYGTFINDNPDIPVRQCDSVEGIKGGAVLLTVHFVQPPLQLAFLRKANDSQSVTDAFNGLYDTLGPDMFMELFPILLCDNGSEFSNPGAIEFDQHERQRCRVFYCNPNAPYEKPNCENNHEMIRRIIPKGTDIGKYTQDQINLMMSHINSYARKSLGNKSPYEVFAFQYGEEILKAFGLSKIPADEIVLSPALLNK